MKRPNIATYENPFVFAPNVDMQIGIEKVLKHCFGGDGGFLVIAMKPIITMEEPPVKNFTMVVVDDMDCDRHTLFFGSDYINNGIKPRPARIDNNTTQTSIEVKEMNITQSEDDKSDDNEEPCNGTTPPVIIDGDEDLLDSAISTGGEAASAVLEAMAKREIREEKKDLEREVDAIEKRESDRIEDATNSVKKQKCGKKVKSEKSKKSED